MGELIITIVIGAFVLIATCFHIEHAILAHLSKGGYYRKCVTFSLIGIFLLGWMAFGLYLRPDFNTRTFAFRHNCLFFAIVLGAIYFILSMFGLISIIDVRGRMRNTIKEMREINKMNEVKDWSGVQTRILNHISRYWFWIFLALPFVALSWLGVSAIGIRVLKYANVELNAMIVFKDGKMSLAGFPLNMLLSSVLGCVGGVVSFKILQWRKAGH